MSKYHKIQTIFKRDMSSKKKNLIEGQWTLPIFEFLAHNRWQFTEKIDGTNIRVYLNQNHCTFEGRNGDSQIPDFLKDSLNNLFEDKVEKLKQLFCDKSFVLYGEGYGNRIQSVGKQYRDDTSFILFDVKVNDVYLNRSSVEDIANFLNIDVVPIIGEGTLFDAIELARHGFNSKIGTAQSEGIVARPKVELLNNQGERIIAKIKTRDFVKE